MGLNVLSLSPQGFHRKCSLNFIVYPYPVTKHNNETYQDVQDVKGKATTERDRPSFVAKKSAGINQPSF